MLLAAREAALDAALRVVRVSSEPSERDLSLAPVWRNMPVLEYAGVLEYCYCAIVLLCYWLLDSAGVPRT